MSLDSEILADSPVGYWKLDETSGTTATDSGSGGNNGTIVGTPSLDKRSLSYKDTVGKSINFDAVDDTIDFSNTLSTLLNTESVISVEALFRVEDISSNRIIFSVILDGTLAGIQLAHTTTAIRFLAQAQGPAPNSQLVNFADTKVNVIRHAVGVVNFAENLVALYVDGDLVGTLEASFATTSFTVGTPTGTDSIGSDQGGASFFDGKLQNVAVYNKALSADRIREHYRATVEYNLPSFHSYRILSHNPVLYAPLDESSGNAINWAGGPEGTLAGGVIQGAVALTPGQSDTSYDFDGVDDIVTISDHPPVQDIWAGGATFSAWIIADTLAVEGMRIWAKDSNPGVFVQTESAGKVILGMVQPFSTSIGQWDTTTQEITLGSVHHVALTYNSDNVGNVPIMYVDGVARAVTTTTAPVGTSVTDVGSNLVIGNRTANDRQWDGKIGHLAFFNEILSADAINQLFTAGSQDSDILGYGQAWKNNFPALMQLPFADLGVPPFQFANLKTSAIEAQIISGAFATALGELPNDARGSTRFNGTDTFIDIGAVSDFLIQNDHDFTISFNIKMIDTATDQQCVMGSGNFSSANNGFDVFYQSAAGGSIRFQSFNGAGVQLDAVSASGVIGDGQWHNVMIGANQTDGAVWIDGVRGSFAVVGTDAIGNAVAPLRIGVDTGLQFLDAELQYLHISGSNMGSSQALMDQTAKKMYEAYASRYAAQVIANNPTGYWRLNEAAGNAIDYGSGLGNLGTYTGGPGLADANTPITNEAGHTSVDFDGVNDHVDMGAMSTEFTAIGTGDFSFAQWLRPANLDATNQISMSWVASTAVQRDRVLLSLSTNDLFQIAAGDAAGGATGPEGATVTASQWHFVVGVRVGGVLRIYQDSALVNTLANTDNIDAYVDQLFQIGQEAFPGSELPFEGQISESAFFQDALTQAEVLDLFKAATVTGTAGTFFGAQGTVLEALLPIQYTVDVLRLDNMAVIGSQDVDTGVSINYSIDITVSGYTGSIMILFRPKTGNIWQASTAYSLGDFVLSADPIGTPHFWECTTAGTTGATEPSWNLSGTTADGTVVWTYVSSLIQPILEGPLPPISA